MPCPEDLTAFEAELATEITRIDPTVAVSGVRCGSVIFTLTGDSVESVQNIATEIETNGVALASFGMVGGTTPVEEENSFPAYGIVLICLGVLILIACVFYFAYQRMEAERVHEQVTQIKIATEMSGKAETKLETKKNSRR